MANAGQTFERHTQKGQFAGANKSLEEMLEWARNELGPGLQVQEEIVDVTNAFYRRSRKEYRAPKSFGKVGRETRVTGYVVKGAAPLTSKYALHVLHDGTPTLRLKHFHRAARLMSILCVRGMENTSLYEVYEPVKIFGIDGVQGFSSQAIDGVVERLRQQDSTFNPESDNFFMFAVTTRNEAVPRIRLSQLWFNQILQQGSNAPYTMDVGEAELFETVFGKERLETVLSDFRLHSFYSAGLRYARWKSSPESMAFSFNKVVGYVKQRGIKPTIYVSVMVGGNNHYVELEPHELGQVLNKSSIPPEIVSRPAVRPFSFEQQTS